MFQTRSVVRLAEEERKNLDHSIELLSGTYDLVTELEALYDFMPQRCQFPEDTNKNDATLAGRVNAHLIFMCRREFTLGTLTLLRGYLGDHRYHLRKAIESCAFAVKMTDSPHFARLWIRVGAGDDAFQKFRDKFKKLFPANDPLLAILGKHYDICAKATHPSMYGVASYFGAYHKRQPSKVGLDIFDLTTDALLVGGFFVSVFVHLKIIRVFQRSLKPYISGRMEPWATLLHELEKKYRAENERWKPSVMAAMNKRPRSSL